MTEQIEYRLVLILPGTREVLAALDNGTARLPRVAISRSERQVEHLTELIKREWDIKAVVLEFLPTIASAAPCAVLEVRDRSKASTRTLQPMHIRSVDRLFLTAEEFGCVVSLLEDDAPRRNPFTRIGWVEEVQRWMTDSNHDQSVAFTNDILQLNAGGGFVLARLRKADGSAYWLKAVGAPNEHEFGITRALAKRLPHYLPPILMAREEWKAWLMEDAGQPLTDCLTLPSVQTAVTALAKLQIDSIQHRDCLKAAGCLDCSIPVLEAHLSEIFGFLEEAMARQTSTKVVPLSMVRLRELELILRRACLKMDDLCIPDTVIHNDINPGNILLSGSRCCFIDWAEGLIGDPFLTFQHICARISRDVPDAGSWLSAAKRCYLEAWLDHLSETQVERAFALTPIVAIASYLYGRGTWLNSADRHSVHFQAHARSLARYIDRAARAPELEEALWG